MVSIVKNMSWQDYVNIIYFLQLFYLGEPLSDSFAKDGLERVSFT